MEERRHTPRLRAYKGGRINALGFPGMDCVVRNLSSAGACLAVDSALVPVDEFYLVIKPEYLTRKCKVAWRQPQQIGVRFV
jgi:hypothetical protein